jgi:hypothetical protein
LDESGALNPERYYPIHALLDNPNAEIIMEVLQYLTKEKPELIKMKDGDSKLPIHHALENECMPAETSKFILETWPDSIFHRDENYHFPLHKLLLHDRRGINGFLGIFKLVVETYPELVHTPSLLDGSYPMHLCVRYQ